MTDEQVLEAVSERNRNRETILQLRTAVRSVVGCIKSRSRSSTCIEDHHPSCQQYLQYVLKRLKETDNGK